MPSKFRQNTSPRSVVVWQLSLHPLSSSVRAVGHQVQPQIQFGWTIGQSTVFYVATHSAIGVATAPNRLFRSSIASVRIAALGISPSNHPLFESSVTIMPSVQETAYPRLKSNITLKELTAIYTPTAEEIGFAQQSTAIGSTTRLGFLILLKTFQRLGYAYPLRLCQLALSGILPRLQI